MGTYKVSGEHAVKGHQPGEVFTDDIPATQEARLIARGAIEPTDGGAGYQADQPAGDGEDDQGPEYNDDDTGIATGGRN